MRKNSQAIRNENIMRYGCILARTFNIDGSMPITIMKRVHRIELEAHRFAEKCCNEDVSESQQERKDARILRRLDDILSFKAQNIPVFINGDPRGYALKVESEYAKNTDLYKDWGGYGILAPDF